MRSHTALETIISGAPSSIGRLTEVMNGRFVAAKHEKPAPRIGRLWRSPKGGSGSQTDRSLEAESVAGALILLHQAQFSIDSLPPGGPRD